MWRKRKGKKITGNNYTSRFTTEENAISAKIKDNFDMLLTHYLKNNDDLQAFSVGGEFGVAYIDTLVDDKKVKQLLVHLRRAAETDEAIQLERLPYSYKKETSLKNVVQALTMGNFVFFVPHKKEAYVINIVDIKERAIEEPAAEATIKGPREGLRKTTKPTFL